MQTVWFEDIFNEVFFCKCNPIGRRNGKTVFDPLHKLGMCCSCWWFGTGRYRRWGCGGIHGDLRDGRSRIGDRFKSIHQADTRAGVVERHPIHHRVDALTIGYEAALDGIK